MTYNTKYTIEDKIRMVSEQKNSGLVAKDWCLKNNITHGSFKNFSHDIKKYNNANNVKTEALKKEGSSKAITWISSPMISPTQPKNIDFSQSQESIDSNVHYTIEKGFFKIRVPEAIKAESLKTLLDVLSRCS